MSWAEVMKVNSRLDTPINHYMWLLDYKTYGERSYAFRDKRIWDELMAGGIAINDMDTAAMALEHTASSGGHVGRLLAGIYGIDAAAVGRCATLQEVVADAAALGAVLGNEDAFGLLAGSGAFKAAIYKSTAAIKNLAGNTHFMEYFASVGTTTTTEGMDVPCYVKQMETAGTPYVSHQAYYETRGACSGASYVGLDQGPTVLREAVDNGGGGYSNETFTVEQFVMSFSVPTGCSGYFAYGAEKSRTYLHTTVTYKPLFG